MTKIHCLLAAVLIAASNSAPLRITPLLGPHCVLAIAIAAQQLPPEGNPGHVEPAPGQNCSRTTQADHACACHRKCVEGTNQEGEADPKVIVVQEDPKCRVYCYKSHCACPIENCE